MTPPRERSRGVRLRLWPLVAAPLLVSVAAAGGGGYVARRVWGDQVMRAALWAAGLACAIFLASALAVWLAARRWGAPAAARLFLGAGLVRIVLLLAAGWVVTRGFGVPPLAFAACAVSMYLALLLVEAYWVGRGLDAAVRARRQISQGSNDVG